MGEVVQHCVDPNIVFEIALATGAKVLEMLVLKFPRWIGLQQGYRVLVRSAAWQLTVTQGKGAWPPFAERLNMCATIFGKHIGVKMVAPIEQSHFQLQNRRAIGAK